MEVLGWKHIDLHIVVVFIHVSPLGHWVFFFATSGTYVKQKKSVVDPTKNVVAADTGTYLLGRNGRGGAEAGPPTPPPTPPLLKPGIRDRERGEEDTGREVDIYCLPSVMGALQVKMVSKLISRRGHDCRLGKKNYHYAKQQLGRNMKDSRCTATKRLTAPVQSLKIIWLFSSLAIYSSFCMCTVWKYSICVHNLNRGWIKAKIYKSNEIQKYVYVIHKYSLWLIVTVFGAKIWIKLIFKSFLAPVQAQHSFAYRLKHRHLYTGLELEQLRFVSVH